MSIQLSRRAHSTVMLFAVVLTIFILASYSRLALDTSVRPIPVQGYRDDKPTPGKDAKRGAVSSESSICSKVGTDIISQGGNAADAMISTVFCIGVVAMYHSGIGGGGFMLVRAPNGTYEVVDFRETAPAAAFQDMYKDNIQASLTGGLASGVPGEVRAMEYIHEHYARLPWRKLLKPAINIARYGFPVNQDLYHFMSSYGLPFLVDDPSFAVDFAPDGTLLQIGQILTRKRYANTLESIAEGGADAFYEGPIANATINALQAGNGTMTLADLKDYTLEIQKPVEIQYRDYRILSSGVPSGGSVGLSALNIVNGFSDFGDFATVNLSTHRLDEAFRFAYGQRVNLGDPAFVPGLDNYQQEMLNQTTAARIRSKISDKHTLNVSAYNPTGLEVINTPGTAAMVTTDINGMTISLTTTVNEFFGSQLCVPETGIIMNDEMNDFSVPNTTNAFGYLPSPANFIRPGKRPLSSITPVIVEFLRNSTLYFTASGAGGSHIITAVIEALWHTLDQNLSITETLARPRFHDQLQPNRISFDWTYNNTTVAFMQSLGHNCTWIAPGFALVQAIKRLPNGTFEAASDPHLHNGAGYAI